jgi:hypothetical protein
LQIGEQPEMKPYLDGAIIAPVKNACNKRLIVAEDCFSKMASCRAIESTPVNRIRPCAAQLERRLFLDARQLSYSFEQSL